MHRQECITHYGQPSLFRGPALCLSTARGFAAGSRKAQSQASEHRLPDITEVVGNGGLFSTMGTVTWMHAT